MMSLKPVLLKAPLAAVLGRLSQAFRTGIIRNVLLVKFLCVALDMLRVVSGHHILLKDFLERT